MRRLLRMEYVVQEAAEVSKIFAAKHIQAAGGEFHWSAWRARPLCRRDFRAGSPDRSGDRRRHRARSAMLVGGDPGIGKSTLLLQLRAARRRGPAGGLCIGRGMAEQVRGRSASGSAARRFSSRRRPVRDILRPSVGQAAGAAGHRFDPDDAQRPHRGRAGARASQVRASAQELVRFAKEQGHRGRPGRPCHQGRHHRRTSRSRTYGGHGAQLRRRAQSPVSNPSGDEEPLRRH